MTQVVVARAAEVLARAWAGSPPAELGARERCRQVTELLRARDAALVADAERTGAPPDPERLRQALAEAARVDARMRTLLHQLAPPGPAPGPPGQNVRINGDQNRVIAGGVIHVGTLSWGVDDEPAAKPEAKPRILYVAASPLDDTLVRIDEEQREIHHALALSGHRYVLESRPAVRAADLPLALMTVRPRILHFSGHGKARTGEICLEDGEGRAYPVEGRDLGSMIAALEGEIECVVLNACYSARQAPDIARHARYVVGMSCKVGDEAAVAFATGFYQAVGSGAPIPQAVAMGHALFNVLRIPEEMAPVLLENGREIPYREPDEEPAPA